MKLTAEQTKLVDSSPGQTLIAALELAELGWNVFPLRPGTKVPLLPRAHEAGHAPCHGECGQDGHGAWDGTTDPDRIIKWWTRVPNAGIGANLGDDRIAFDIDYQNGGTKLEALPTTRTHLSGRGNGNCHMIYRIAPGTKAAKIQPKTAALGRGIDIKVGRGAYIVVPPTRHEATNQPYTVTEINLGIEHILTDAEVDAIWAEAGVAFTGGAKTRPTTSVVTTGHGEPRPIPTASAMTTNNVSLAELLTNPPAQGGRNDWLTRVAGHYAKQHRGNRDKFMASVTLANTLLNEPLDDFEIEKTANSIWNTETINHPERAAAEHTGYLTSQDGILYCQVIIKQGDQTMPALAPFADFDIEALGVAVDELDRRMYWVRLHWNNRTIDATLNAEILGDDRAIRKWLAGMGMSADPPFNAMPRTATGVRLLRYLNSQNPPQVHIVDTLGWHDDLKAFVTHDGLINALGFKKKEEAGVVADPKLVERDVAPYTYGFNHNWDKARAALREILTFQDETVTSVFGAWWAACLLKPQIQTRTSLFPFFGVEAVSESGKTNGFFALMVQLNGNTRGEIAPTRPVLRDYSSANRNGIVWADDLDSLEPYGELLRASTSNGTAAKMDMDRSGIKNTQVVAPILITGEALGMSQQKALMDRSVVLNVPSPKHRISTRGDWPQWEDVMDLRSEYPEENGGLATIAGWFVQNALMTNDRALAVLKRVKRIGSGRHNDKMAVLRTGAAMLDWFTTGDEEAWESKGEHSRRVEAWIAQENLNGWLDKDNTLTTRILPWALRTWGLPQSPLAGSEMGRWSGIDTPVFVRPVGNTEWDGTLLSTDAETVEVWVSIPQLAAAWARDHGHRVEARTDSEQALAQQANALTMERGKAWALSGTKRKGWYRKLPQAYAEAVIARAQGSE